MFKYALALAAAVTSFQTHAVDQEVYEKLDIFAHVLEKIRTSYVEEVTETEVIESAINGMLTSLDPHSAYLSNDGFKDLREQTRGEFGGLGIEVTMENGLVKVVSPIEDTPAEKAGLEAKDLIVKIDNEDVQGLTLGEAVDKMRGKIGSTILLNIFRESATGDAKSFDVTLTRAVIQVKPVKSQLVKNDEDPTKSVGYLRITSFNDHTDSTLQKYFRDLEKNNTAPLAGIILDLRNNPGGLLNQAVAVADEFLDKGEIVSTRGRIKGQNTRYTARKGDLLSGKPIVVLINGGSASASEIVAGALQDHKRAILMGNQSFGKGSVQTIMNLPGGAGMRLTTALYYTPSGTSIQAEGITPDIIVNPLKNVEEVDTNGLPSEASLNGHIEVNKKRMSKAEKAAAKLSEKEQAWQERLAKDYQLQRAIGTVQALALWK